MKTRHKEDFALEFTWMGLFHSKGNYIFGALKSNLCLWMAYSDILNNGVAMLRFFQGFSLNICNPILLLDWMLLYTLYFISTNLPTNYSIFCSKYVLIHIHQDPYSPSFSTNLVFVMINKKTPTP